MRIVVLGGGVVGVTTAYQLQKDGHDVAVIERNSEVATEASWGNAGMIAPGHSFVWSSPKAPMILLKSLFLDHQALRFKFSADPRLYSWSFLFLMECTPEKARRNTLLKHRLAAYSQSVLDDVAAEEAIEYNRSQRGILYFHRDQQALDRGVEHMKLLESDGQAIKVLDRGGRDRARTLSCVGKDEDCRRDLLSDRRDRRIRQIHASVGGQDRRPRRRSSNRRDDHSGSRRRATASLRR